MSNRVEGGPCAASGGGPFVRLERVSKRFGRHKAVDSVSLDVEKGTFTTLLGPSGCGKTTTLRMVAGFYEPDEGRILIGDRVVNDVPPHQRDAAMVFQDYALFPHMTVRENVAYGLRIRRVPAGEVRERVGRVLEMVGLVGLEARSPGSLSGGQQQRVALARALVLDPSVLLLDEPLSNLDAKLRVSVRRELKAIQRQLGITAVYVTHDQDEALELSDTVAVMNQGRVLQVGTPWDVYYRPANRFVADFIGAANFIEGRVVGETARVTAAGSGAARPGAAAVAVVSTSLGDVRLVPEPGRRLEPGRSVLLCMRPECVRLVPSPGALGPDLLGDVNLFAGVVTQTSFLGKLARHWVRAHSAPGQVTGEGSVELVVDVPDPGAAALESSQVTLAVPVDRVHIIPSREGDQA